MVNFRHKTVLIRTDYNVPLKDGRIYSDKRIQSSLEVINHVLDQQPRCLILLSHLGRPQKREAQFSLQLVAEHLEKLLHKPVILAKTLQDLENLVHECHLAHDKPKIILLENLRFWQGEATNSQQFAAELVQCTQAEVFIQDGFAVAHRATATTDAITKILPSYASQHFIREYQTVGRFLTNTKRPLVAIVGGAKVSDKLDFVLKLAQTVDYLIIGGAMANPFLAAAGVELGQSLLEPKQEAAVRRVYQAWQTAGKSLSRLILPSDVRVGLSLTSNNSQTKAIGTIQPAEIIGDIGPQTIQTITNIIQQAKAIIWNGNLGYTENPQFRAGSQAITEAIITANVKALVGGGDTVGFVEKITTGRTCPNLFLSTGGGATLELIAHKKLIGARGLLNLKNQL